jgi:tetratricopeptide (TPR) repeat protein
MSFGARLRQERARRHLSQEALAEALGVSPRSISRWENEQILPQPSVRLLLSRFLGFSPDELFDDDGKKPTTHEALWGVPYPRNPYFTGREAVLHALHTRLTSSEPIALTQAPALSGLGGIGKTQVAIEYAYRYAQAYRAIFWLASETSESLIASMQRIADQLHLAEHQATEQPRMVAAVQRWLMDHPGWLLIADNVEDADLLQTILPPDRQGTLLLTTRHQTLGPLAEPLELSPMSSEEGVTLILRRARWFPPSLSPVSLSQESLRDIPAEAQELVKYLEGLPLALDQAGAYIEETGCSVADYLQRCREQRKQVLARRGSHEGTHPASVATTLKLSIEQVERQHAAAADLLRVCAFLHPEAIPEDLFQAGSSHLGPALSQVTADPYQFDLALAALRGASLITRHAQTQTISVHRLVQAVLQDGMEPAEARLWSERVVRVVNAAFPEPEFDAWAQCERCLAHALACASLLEQASNALPEAGELLYKAGSYLLERARYAEAEPLLLQAVALGEQFYSSNPMALILRLEKQGELFWRQGKFEQTVQISLRALTIEEQHLGANHPQTAETLNNLAVQYVLLGKYEEAEHLHQRSLHIREQRLGPDHPQTAETLNNLAFLYWNLGRYEEAERLYQRSLHIREQRLGPDHPLTALSLKNLASAYRDLGKSEEAGSLFQRALMINEQQLGANHPETAFTLNNFATLHRNQGRYQQAEQLYRRALAINEQQLGPDHPATATVLNNMAILYHRQERYEQAECLYQRALSIREQQLGSEHPETAATLGDLATLYREQMRYAEAKPLYQRALAISEKRFEREHPAVVLLRKQYALLLQSMESKDSEGL